MIGKIKCLVKGHKFLKHYNQMYGYYRNSINDRCICCKRKRMNDIG